MDIVLDFDGTITTHDTIATLAGFAISRRGGDSLAEWDRILEQYTSDYEAYTATAGDAADRTGLEEELAFLNGLAPVERASVERVSASGLFGGIEPGEFERFGRTAVREGMVGVRRGFARLRDAVLGMEKGRGSGRMAVVSVNWSERFIRGCCSADEGHGEGDDDEAGDGVGAELDIVANMVEFPSGRVRGAAKSSGEEESEPVLTAGGKHRALETVARRWGRRTEELVYVGDSPTDLECLVACRKGIVMVNEEEGSALLRTLKRLNFRVPPVAECGPDDRLSWARDFNEVLDSGILDGLGVGSDPVREEMPLQA